MNWDRIEGQWTVMKGSIKEKWGKLTHDDLDMIAGKHEKLIGKIQNAYGISHDEADREVKEWMSLADKHDKDHKA